MSDPGARPRVLVVDDVQANLSAIEALLKDLDCEVTLTSSGRGALRELLHAEFAVMLLDVQMPEMDGYEVARYVHSNPATSAVPIVFVTATNDTRENVLRGYGSGAVDFLFKPIDAAVLRSKVRVFLALFESRRQIAAGKRALEEKNTELERAYRELKDTQARLVQTAKMASLGALVAGVAHEVNNPLGFAVSHVATVRRRLAELTVDSPESNRPKWELLQRRLEETALGLERIQDLVVKLRTFSRLDEGERKYVSLKESVEAVILMLRHRAGERIEIATELAEPDLLECFPGPLNQALMNLVVNAIDAVEGPGRVTISSEVTREAVIISVRDTGRGIAPELRERVFEPFFTTKPPGLGTGLGLSITYSIARTHGGTLEIAETGEHGTCLRLTIPKHVHRSGDEQTT